MDAFYASVEQRDNPALRGQARSPSAAIRPSAASSRRRATRRARSACARRSRCRARSASAPRSSSSGPTSRSTARSRSRCLRSTARSRRSSSRCRSTRRISTSPRTPGSEPLGVTVAQRIKQAIHETTGLTASAGVAPEQVPRQDRVGLEEARRADRDRARAHRIVSPGSARRRAVGRRVQGPRSGFAPTASSELVDVRAQSLDALRDRRRQLGASGCSTWRCGHDDRPVEPNHERKSCGSECTYEKDLTDLDEIGRRNRRDGPRRRALAGQARDLRAHGRDQSALRRLHDHHAQSQRSRARRAMKTRIATRARGPARTRPTPAAGRFACSASACTTSRRRMS